MAQVVFNSVTKRFAQPNGPAVCAVDQLSLRGGDNEFLAILGPSGCGKTTTLRLVAGLETPDSGTILLNDIPLNAVPPKDRDVAMVFQAHALFPHLTARENMGFGLRLRKFSKNEIDNRVEEAANFLGLKSLLDRRPQTLSGGECQRVALGRALVRRPKLFLFDEPLSSLDGPMRAMLRNEIARLHKSLSTPILYVTHDCAEAFALADRIAIMREGRVEQVGTAAELKGSPVNSFVSDFIKAQISTII